MWGRGRVGGRDSVGFLVLFFWGVDRSFFLCILIWGVEGLMFFLWFCINDLVFRIVFSWVDFDMFIIVYKLNEYWGKLGGF